MHTALAQKLVLAIAIPVLWLMTIAAAPTGYIGFDPWALVAETHNAADGETLTSWNAFGLVTGGRTGLNLMGGASLAPGWYIEAQASSSFGSPDWKGSAAIGLAWLPLEGLSGRRGGPIFGIQATGKAWLFPDGYQAWYFIPVTFGGYRIPASGRMAVDLRLDCGGIEYDAYFPKRANALPDGWNLGFLNGFAIGATLVWTF